MIKVAIHAVPACQDRLLVQAWSDSDFTHGQIIFVQVKGTLSLKTLSLLWQNLSQHFFQHSD